MLGLFRRTPPPLVGIDISTTAVKLLGLSNDSNGYRVDHYAVTALPPEAIVENNIVVSEMVSEAIEKTIKLGRVKLKHVAIAVSGSSVITKIISMPKDMPEKQMEEQISLEADQYIPYALDEVYLDFQVLGDNKDNPETVDVLLAAARSDTVDERVNAVTDVGLTPNVVDIEAYAMETAYELIARQLPIEIRNATIAIVDIGATATTLYVLQEGQSVFTRDQNLGGRQLTEEIQHRYGLSFDEAGRAKKSGELPEDYATDLLQPFMESLSQQTSRLLQTFFSSTSQHQVDQIILCGGTALLPGLADVMEQQIGVPTMIANPLAEMSVASGVNADSLQKDATSLMIACGLAMRSLDHATR
ncbi:MAG: pilus assembly protein PilM [Gammaproteobacteria bacterium]|nr:pilus assembly protein PilM [Gammaproteobacteria bacterium]